MTRVLTEVKTTKGRKIAPAGAISGPLVASYTIEWEGHGGATLTNKLEQVRSTIAYYIREGRDMTGCKVTRTESCPAAGCNGNGTRSVRRRGHLFLVEVPCVGCRGQHDTRESLVELVPLDVGDAPLNDVLERLGYTTQPAEWGAKVILQNGFPISAGTAGAIWLWLRETGQIL